MLVGIRTLGGRTAPTRGRRGSSGLRRMVGGWGGSRGGRMVGGGSGAEGARDSLGAEGARDGLEGVSGHVGEGEEEVSGGDDMAAGGVRH